MAKFKNEHSEMDDAKVFLNKKVVYFGGNVTQTSSLNFIAALREADSKPGMITVVMTSDGGWVEGGMTMHDAVRSVRNEVLMVGAGAVHSAAVLPFEAGDYRMMYPSTRMLLHDFSMNIHDSTLTNLETFHNELKDLFKIYCAYVSQRSNLTEEHVKGLMKKETYLSATTAKELNLIDAIIPPFPKGQTIAKKTKRKSNARKS